MGYNPQESLENTINTVDTLLGVHPIVPPKMGPIRIQFESTKISSKQESPTNHSGFLVAPLKHPHHVAPTNIRQTI